MKIRKIYSNVYIRGTLLVLAGLLSGWVIFHQSPGDKTNQELPVQENNNTIWTCAMHPQIRMDHPGKCPICGMELIPLEHSTATIDPDAIVMTEEGIKLAEVQTSIVSREKPVKEVRLYGKIQADERLIQTQPAHVPGRIENLMVNFTGEEIQKGQIIARIYSPEMITAQEELLEAVKMKEMQPLILDAAREKLRQWKFTDSQIADIENSGTTKSEFDVHATVSGIVINKRVNVGDYVSQGSPLYEIADLSNVWALFDAYESDLPWIRKGNRISFTLQSHPGKEFSGIVSFIDPVINPQTRVARVRLEIPNSGNILKPEMFATGLVKANLASSGSNLVIPQSSVLWTGTRSVVYIKTPDAEVPSFALREITLGPALSNSYVVLDGLTEGEEIVTNGTFSVDASAQLQGKPSMMNTQGGKVLTGHQHGEMEISGNQQQNKSNSVSHSENPGEQSVQNEPEPISKSNVSMDFIMQLNTVFDKYIILKNALVESDFNTTRRAGQELQKTLAKIDMELISGDAQMKWMEISGNLKGQIAKIISSGTIDLQRTAFSLFSHQLYQAIKTFGLMGKTLYYQFCPMINDNKGAFWLSEKQDIRNPYYGEKMLTCGETIETLKF